MHVPGMMRRERTQAAAPKVAVRLFSAVVLTTMSLAYAVWFGVLAIVRHQALATNALDLGYYDQTLWNTSNGAWFRFTTFQYASFGLDIDLGTIKDVTNLLAFHVEPILIAFSLLYKVSVLAQPETMLLLQSVVIALGVVPLYGLVTQWLESRLLALIICASYLIAPSLEAASMSDFHPVAMTPTYALAALWCLHRNDWRWRVAGWIACCLLLLASKEEMSLLVCMLGVYALANRQWLSGSLAMTLGAAWYFIAFQWILPSFSYSTGSPFLARFGPFTGKSVPELIFNLIAMPVATYRWLTLPERIHFLIGLFATGGFLCVLVPLTLLPAVPSLAVDLLSTFSWMHSGGGHYTAPLVPFVVAAGAIGARRVAITMAWIWSKLTRVQTPICESAVYRVALPILCCLVLLSGLVRQRAEGLTPIAASFQARQPTSHDRLALSLLNAIPADAPVAASTALYPHLSHRARAYLFPTVGDATYVAVDVTSSSYPTLPELAYEQLNDLLASGAWRIVHAQDGVLILHKEEAVPQSLPLAFYSFARAAPEKPLIPIGAVFDDSLELIGYRIDRYSEVDLGQRFFSLTAEWRALRPLADDLVFDYTLSTDESGSKHPMYGKPPTLIWYPTSQWPVDTPIVMTLLPASAAGYPFAHVRVHTHDDGGQGRTLKARYQGQDDLESILLSGQVGPANWRQLLLAQW